jgi:hypothetical protein
MAGMNGLIGANGLAGPNGLFGPNGLAGSNGLAGPNGLWGTNGLMGANGLAGVNGLAGTNGLAGANGLMTTSTGRKVVQYLVKCALASGDTLVKQDQSNNNYTFAGGIGLCPTYKNNGIYNNSGCVESLSACLMAHINTAGVHVPIWLDSSDTAIGWGVDRTNYPMQEGTFFGDLFDTGSLSNIGKQQINGPAAYYCEGAGFPTGANGVVAGRLGANQSGAPYTNPFGTGATCQGVTMGNNAAVNVGYYTGGIGGSCPAGSNTNPSQGCPDGYQEMQYPYGTNAVPWNHAITVWRNNSYTPVFDTGYQYELSAVLTQSNPMVLDTGTSPLQGWNRSAGLATSVFNMAPSGSNWTLSPINNTSQCVDAGSATNGTGLVLASCNGSTSQQWKITANAMNGSFNVAVASTGRCMNVRSGSTAAGAVMEVYDCTSGWTSEQFNIQATVASATAGQTTSVGTNPCANFCQSPIEIGAQSYNSGNIGTGAGCYESVFNVQGFTSSNMSGRTFAINGVNNPSTLPAKVNGGYCFTATSGGYSYASFGTW